MNPCYLVLDCIPAADGGVRVIDVHGGVGGGLENLSAAYGGKTPGRARLQPYLQRLGQIADGKLILFVHDAFHARQTFPDSFFNLVQQNARYGPITDWVPDYVNHHRAPREAGPTPGVDDLGLMLDPIAARLKLKLAYASVARIDYGHREGNGGPMVLLSGFQERSRRRATSVILSPEEIGVGLFSGASERFPDDFKRQQWFPIINPPVLDALLENRWLLPALLHGTPSAKLLARWIPVGMGLRRTAEVMEFIDALKVPGGLPAAVLKPSHRSLSPGVRFLDRTALRALAARQPEARIGTREAARLLSPCVDHSYEEISGYRGKLLDNLLRLPGAAVHDHGDGTFHFSAPFPFLECTVSVLQEYVEPRPVRSRRTGKLHRGSLRVVFFDRKIVAAIYRLDEDPDDGTFRDLTRPDVRTFVEAAGPEDEANLHACLQPLVVELERQVGGRVLDDDDLNRLRERWVLEQARAE